MIERVSSGKRTSVPSPSLDWNWIHHSNSCRIHVFHISEFTISLLSVLRSLCTLCLPLWLFQLGSCSFCSAKNNLSEYMHHILNFSLDLNWCILNSATWQQPSHQRLHEPCMREDWESCCLNSHWRKYRKKSYRFADFVLHLCKSVHLDFPSFSFLLVHAVLLL